TPPWSDTHENMWDQVNDFKWLKADHSPNWSVLAQDRRHMNSFWTDVVGGKTELQVIEILKRSGIAV
ncbi:unnamed protein product, partial [Parascedosporium putredinis]